MNRDIPCLKLIIWVYPKENFVQIPRFLCTYAFNTLSHLSLSHAHSLSLSRSRSRTPHLFTLSVSCYFVYVTAGEIFFIVLFENVTISPRIFVMNVDDFELWQIYVRETQFERLKVNAHTHHNTWILILCLSFIKYLFIFIMAKIIGGSAKFHKTIYWTLKYNKKTIPIIYEENKQQ